MSIVFFFFFFSRKKVNDGLHHGTIKRSVLIVGFDWEMWTLATTRIDLVIMAASFLLRTIDVLDFHF